MFSLLLYASKHTLTREQNAQKKVSVCGRAFSGSHNTNENEKRIAGVCSFVVRHTREEEEAEEE